MKKVIITTSMVLVSIQAMAAATEFLKQQELQAQQSKEKLETTREGIAHGQEQLQD